MEGEVMEGEVDGDVIQLQSYNHSHTITITITQSNTLHSQNT